MRLELQVIETSKCRGLKHLDFAARDAAVQGVYSKQPNQNVRTGDYLAGRAGSRTEEHTAYFHLESERFVTRLVFVLLGDVEDIPGTLHTALDREELEFFEDDLATVAC